MGTNDAAVLRYVRPARNGTAAATERTRVDAQACIVQRRWASDPRAASAPNAGGVVGMDRGRGAPEVVRELPRAVQAQLEKMYHQRMRGTDEL